MKKLFLSLVLLCACGSISAQVTWNVKGGIGFSSFWLSETGMDVKSKMVWRLGVGIETPLTHDLLFMPSLEIAQKGAKMETPDDPDDDPSSSYYFHYEDDARLTYLQIPLLLAYRIPLGTVNATFKAGPHIAYALSGKMKSNYVDGRTSGTESINLFDLDDYEEDVKSSRLDVGITVGVGFEYHRAELGIELEQGFTNMFELKDEYDKNYIKNTALYITLGYKF